MSGGMPTNPHTTTSLLTMFWKWGTEVWNSLGFLEGSAVNVSLTRRLSDVLLCTVLTSCKLQHKPPRSSRWIPLILLVNTDVNSGECSWSVPPFFFVSHFQSSTVVVYCGLPGCLLLLSSPVHSRSLTMEQTVDFDMPNVLAEPLIDVFWFFYPHDGLLYWQWRCGGLYVGKQHLDSISGFC